jgi:hypothetical protein
VYQTEEGFFAVSSVQKRLFSLQAGEAWRFMVM